MAMMMRELTLGLDQERLCRQLTEGWRRAHRLARPVLVSATVPTPVLDPLRWFAHGAALGPRHLFMRPSAGYALAGIGSAWTTHGRGAARFQTVGAAWRDLLDGALIDRPDAASLAGPLLLGGFAFDPLRPTTPLWQDYPPALLSLPRYLLSCQDGACWLTVSSVVWPDTQPDAQAGALLAPLGGLLAPATTRERPPAHAEVTDPLPPQVWQEIVRGVAAEIRGGALEKAVLARAARVCGTAPFAPEDVLRRLRAAYPGCYIFAMSQGPSTFLGASPEQLVSLRDGQVRAMALAGSIRRGVTDQEDSALGQQLLASAKDSGEHAVVVRVLAEGLRAVCADVRTPPAPQLLRLHNVQHLHTPITARVRAGRSVLDLVERLHPTPAVGGYPREAALRLIRDREGLDRGWYAGPLGWVDARGEGEFAVALRSALLRGSEATLFAGCGIVADSQPESEYAESALKMRPLLTALGVLE